MARRWSPTVGARQDSSGGADLGGRTADAGKGLQLAVNRNSTNPLRQGSLAHLDPRSRPATPERAIVAGRLPAIVVAVGNPASPLHVHVGADADAFLKLWCETGTFESFGPAASAMLFGEASK